MGALLLATALGVFVVILTVPFPEGTHSAASPWTVSSSSSATLPARVTWTGATPATKVYLAAQPGDCGSIPPLVATGGGPSGSIDFQLAPGRNYSVFACNDSSAATTTFTFLAVGAPTYVYPLDALAAALGFVGGLLLVSGLRRRYPGGPRRIRRHHLEPRDDLERPREDDGRSEGDLPP